MEPRDRALLHARLRIGVGAAFVLLPGIAGRMWIGPDAARRPVKVLARAFGVRDLAIGLGVVIALDRGTPVRGWLEAGALSDAVDTCASLLAGELDPSGAPLARDRRRRDVDWRPALSWPRSSTTGRSRSPARRPRPCSPATRPSPTSDGSRG